MIYSRTHFTDTKKLAYLHHSLQHGPAKHFIEGLLGTSSEYSEAMSCLQKRYDRPRVLHHAQVQAIFKAPVVKDGRGKELQYLHDICSQYLQPLKVMKCKPSGTFITSSIEMKVD